MLQSESVVNLYKALSKAQAEFTSVPLDKINKHFNNKYASLRSTQEMYRPVLGLNGLALIQSVESEDRLYRIETRLIHVSGEFIASKIDLIITQNNMQGLGSAITYAKRYAAQALLGISGDDDDDGNAASGKNEKEAIRARQPGKQGNQEPVPRETNSKKVDPKDFILNLGNIKNTKLGSIPLEKLSDIGAWLSQYIKDNPNSKERKYYGLVYGNIKELLKKNSPAPNKKPEPIPDLEDTPMPEESDLVNYADSQENPFNNFDPIYLEKTLNELDQPKKQVQPEVVDKIVISVDIPDMEVNGLSVDMLEREDLILIVEKLQLMIHEIPKRKDVTSLFVLQSKIKKYLSGAK